jgi:hypothetical protein
MVSMEEVDMDGSESDQELTGNETDESKWASKVFEVYLYDQQKIDIKHFVAYTCTCIGDIFHIHVSSFK